MNPTVTRLLHRAQAEHARHHAAVRELQAEVAAAQRACPHERTQFHPDAAGGYDKRTDCLDCGAEKIRGKWLTASGIVGKLE